ncbi:phosphoenolpyruvate--protein phosphotransferase [Buttiauxella sp. B2]|uniref:phosphoenolpyruvate--protein phosphotransferase n=1 Tax=Buttiauxella sp. B2 TaxID=2587812 RepID=UPI00111F5F8A|nr:phosphoenolpyruvate--protein phosphotransferase [Buttiauxella sp. B2]TNV21011.1 phosphoenolpyruvate--protein phosphotransferase [Buttiauxella sp. B2]
MLTLDFICTLPNGIHARPASEIEQRTQPFKASITLINLSKKTQADAKSVLGMIGADITHGDQCQFLIEGEDQQVAFELLHAFMHDEFEDCDEPLVLSPDNHTQPLPVFIEHACPKYMRGNGVSKGIGRGVPVHIDSVDLHELSRHEPATDVVLQQQQLLEAWAITQQTLCSADVGAEHVLAAQLKLLSDPAFKSCLFSHITARNALQAIVLTAQTLSQPLLNSSSQYLRERVIDIRDLCQGIATNLLGRPLESQLMLTQDSIVICSGTLTPGQFLRLRNPHLKGIVMGDGGETSHTVILARSFGIPLLCGVTQSEGLTHEASMLILDSRYGLLVANPNEAMESWYRLETAKQRAIAKRSAPLCGQQVSTADGVTVSVLANTALAIEAQSAFALGADGVGLFRTEMLFCERSQAPDEDEQFQAYSEVLRSAAGKKITIRTLDIGGDKPCDFLDLPKEENPFLGYRAVRMYPQFHDVFTTQARALLRASAVGPLNIMVPMVATLAEIQWLHSEFQRIAATLQQEDIPLGEWHLGIMVEVPSTLYLLEKAANYLDFVSIGSNDLAQYFLACDRGNPYVRHLYDYRNPTFLALMRDITQRAQAAGLAISLCGEMAADKQMLPLLVGMGLTELSMATGAITQCKEALTTLNVQQCQKLLETAIACDTGEDVVEIVEKFTRAQSQKPVLASELLLLDKTVNSKEEAIKLLTDNLEVQQRAISGSQVERAIWEREAVFSTALGFSVAIPHCKSPHVSHSSISLLRANSPVSWGEGIDVQLVIMLTVNEQEQNNHMKIFSRLARKLMHSDFREQLQTLSDAATLTDLLSSELAL